MSVPVTILTGFLGSGKTTVLQKILAQENYGDTAVLVNEFGEVGIDQQLVAPIAPNVVLLDSGCLCCQIRGELKEALTGLLDARAQKSVPPFKRIVIETTGLAEPTPTIATIQADPMLTHQLAVARTITIVDAVNGNEMADSNNRVWTQQVSAADVLLISKAALAPDDATVVEKRFTAMLPGVSVMRHGLSSPLPNFDAIPTALHAPQAHDHAKDISTHGGVHSLALHISEPVDWTAFGVWLSALARAWQSGVANQRHSEYRRKLPRADQRRTAHDLSAAAFERMAQRDTRFATGADYSGAGYRKNSRLFQAAGVAAGSGRFRIAGKPLQLRFNCLHLPQELFHPARALSSIFQHFRRYGYAFLLQSLFRCRWFGCSCCSGCPACFCPTCCRSCHLRGQ